MLTERTIINALIIGVSILLAPFVISESLTFDYLPALCVASVLAAIWAFFFLKEKLALTPLIGAYVAGSLNFLPIPLNAAHIGAIFLILYFITGYVVIRQRPIRLGEPTFFWPIMIVVGIVLYHVHSLSLGALGATTEGARPAFFIYLFTIAYFCAINLPTAPVAFLSRVPFYTMLWTALSAIPYLASTYIPALAPYFYSVTSNVNVEAYFNTEGGTEEAVGQLSAKLAAFAPLGASTQMYLLAHYPIGTWFSPNRFWVVCLSFICLVLTICCGYRSAVFSFGMVFLVGTWCYYGWRAAFLPVVAFVLALSLVTASSNNLIQLPLRSLPSIAQRTLSFLPGDWDPEAIDSGKGSNEFRKNIEDVYLKEYAWQSPLLGTGFAIDKAYFDSFATQHVIGAEANKHLEAEIFIVGKLYHTGWISVYDSVGIIGMLAFIGLQLAVTLKTAHFVFSSKVDRRSPLYPLYVWLHIATVTQIAGYYTVFGSFGDGFDGMVVNAIVLSHLLDLEKTTEPSLVPKEAVSGFSGLTGKSYGTQYGRY